MGEKPTTTFLVECFWPGVSGAALEDLDARVRRAAAEGKAGTDPVAYQGTVIVPEDEVVFCLFEGCSLEAVRAVAETADVPFARIVETVMVQSVGRTATSGERAPEAEPE